MSFKVTKRPKLWHVMRPVLCTAWLAALTAGVSLAFNI